MDNQDYDETLELELKSGNYQKKDVEEVLLPLWDRSEITDHKIVIVVANNKRRTSQKMSLFELTEAIGIRSAQIERGVPSTIDVGQMSNPVDIARMEMLYRRNPLIVERKIREIGNIIYVEQWKVREMTYTDLTYEKMEDYLLEQKKYDECFIDGEY